MTSLYSSDNKCEPPCIDYSNQGAHGDLPYYIYQQWNQCGIISPDGDIDYWNNLNKSSEEKCKDRPLLNNKSKPFISDFSTYLDLNIPDNYTLSESWRAVETAYNNSSYDYQIKPISFSSNDTLNKSSYPNLNSSCRFKHNTWIIDYSGESNTVCLLDYMNEHIQQYNKNLCYKIASSNMYYDASGDEACKKVCSDNWYSDQCGGVTTTVADTNLRDNTSTVSFTDEEWSDYLTTINEDTRESQLKKDFNALFNDNMFEIIVLSVGIMAILYSIRKY